MSSCYIIKGIISIKGHDSKKFYRDLSYFRLPLVLSQFSYSSQHFHTILPFSNIKVKFIVPKLQINDHLRTCIIALQYIQGCGNIYSCRGVTPAMYPGPPLRSRASRDIITRSTVNHGLLLCSVF